MTLADVRKLLKNPKLKPCRGDDWETVWAKTTVLNYESEIKRAEWSPFPAKAREAVRQRFLSAYVMLLNKFLGE